MPAGITRDIAGWPFRKIFRISPIFFPYCRFPRKSIVSLNAHLKAADIPVSVADTKTNLNKAAIRELEKIKTFYPEILEILSSESHDQSVVHCMYSWKSHRQNQKIIKKIKKYAGSFFEPLADKIESMQPAYHVCEICGSTLDKNPKTADRHLTGCRATGFQPIAHGMPAGRPPPSV